MSRTLQHTDLKIRGMDCAECAMHVEAALGALAGVESAKVFFAAERAKVVYDEQQVDLDAFRAAVEKAGYHIAGEEPARENRMPALLTLAFVGVVAAIIFVELVAEQSHDD